MSDHFVVIGSNSFSGASFVAHLLKQGATVSGISRSCSSSRGMPGLASSSGKAGGSGSASGRPDLIQTTALSTVFTAAATAGSAT